MLSNLRQRVLEKPKKRGPVRQAVKEIRRRAGEAGVGKDIPVGTAQAKTREHAGTQCLLRTLSRLAWPLQSSKVGKGGDLGEKPDTLNVKWTRVAMAP